ncbi:MAG: hypothetical protein C0596_15755 [Marinilabiliales bacterium]|nr:MAG: hypothetical protein C0596_15755 [Marinilabiliales bacterium]
MNIESKLIKIIFMFILYLIAFNSCSLNRSDDIEVGEYDKMSVRELDTIVRGDQSPTSYKIDIDRNLKKDFELLCTYTTSVGGTYRLFQINCLHDNAFINTEVFVDSIFTHESVSTFFDEQTGKYIQNTYPYETCGRYCEESEFLKTTQSEKIKQYSTSDIISFEESWKSNSIVVYNSAGGGEGMYEPQETYTSGDTIFNLWATTKWNCSHTLPQDEEVYIGIKIRNKLGWIKLSLSYVHMDAHIIEVAIQK